MVKLHKTSHLFLLLIAIAISITTIMTVRYFVRKDITNELQLKSVNTLNIQALNVQTYTEKFGVAASILSRRPDITNYVQQAKSAREIIEPSVLRILNNTNALAGSNNIWLVDTQGNVLITSEQSAEKKENLPLNISNQDYFKTALQGRLGRANVIRQIDQRFYLFAAPIYTKNGVVGATVILVPIVQLEQTWAIIPEPIIVTDSTQKVLLSNVREWQLLNIENKNSKLPFNDSFINSSYLEKVTSVPPKPQ